MTQRQGFNKETTAQEVLQGIDVAGKVFLITGGSSGLGAESARVLAMAGAKVIITARDVDKARRVTDAIQAGCGAEVEIEELELGSFASIRAFADRINARGEKIDELINNAGVMACPQAKTEDGFEMQFGANHLGHFLLTMLIVPALKDGGRVVSLSSAGHKLSPVVFEDINFENREYDSWLSYGQAKTANALFAVGLNKHLADRNIEAFAVHPGAIATDLGRHLTDADIQRLLQQAEDGAMEFKSMEQGATTQIYAATAPELTGKGGAYLANCAICEILETDDPARHETTVLSYAVDDELAERLWSLSEDMVQQRF